jgi:hypothetical protein
LVSLPFMLMSGQATRTHVIPTTPAPSDSQLAQLLPSYDWWRQFFNFT